MAAQYLSVVSSGLLISLSGSLPLGNLNITAMQIAARENLRKAILFATGVTIIEMGYLLGTLVALRSIAGSPSIFAAFRLVSVVVLLAMATGCFITNKKKENKQVVLDNKINRLLLGAGMSMLNPLQIPFWACWALYLLTQSVLTAQAGVYSLFTISAGSGTFIALLLFAFAGNKLAPFLSRHDRSVNIITGLLFIVIAAIQIIKSF